jgi:hypothetical protein
MTQEFRQVILEMHMLAGGSTQSLEGRVTGTKDRDPMPSGEPHPLYDEFEARWRAARTVGAKQAVLKDAQDALEGFRKMKDPPNVEAFVNRDTLPWKRAIANSDMSIAATAQKFSVSRVTVYAYIEKYRMEDAA